MNHKVNSDGGCPEATGNKMHWPKLYIHDTRIFFPQGPGDELQSRFSSNDKHHRVSPYKKAIHQLSRDFSPPNPSHCCVNMWHCESVMHLRLHGLDPGSVSLGLNRKLRKRTQGLIKFLPSLTEAHSSLMTVTPHSAAIFVCCLGGLMNLGSLELLKKE